MKPILLAVVLSLGGLFVALSLQDPLAAASLTDSQRAAGYQSVEFEVNGTDCKFCRINVERNLKDVPGVLAAKADMAHHRARVVYDPNVVAPTTLMEAVRGIGVGAALP